MYVPIETENNLFKIVENKESTIYFDKKWIPYIEFYHGERLPPQHICHNSSGSPSLHVVGTHVPIYCGNKSFNSFSFFIPINTTTEELEKMVYTLMSNFGAAVALEEADKRLYEIRRS